MIRYALICENDHEFEAWFSSSSDFDVQQGTNLLLCPECQTRKVEKAIMAPNVSTSRKRDSIAEKQKLAMTMLNKTAEKIRRDIAENCDYVGPDFAEEARAMHYGEKEERPIYGEASLKEAASLHDEGIDVAPLPDVLSPKPKAH